jgi:tetratricopeptide (TPR) repeat protein
MERTFCFGCGAEMKPQPGEIAPMCPKCRGGKGDAEAADQRWMVRNRGQRPQGPHKRDVIEGWILRNLVQPTDEVARVDGSWAPFNVHADFRAWFTPGHELFEKRTKTLSSRRRENVARDWKKRFKTTFSLVAIVAIIGLSYLAVQHRATVIPEAWIDAASERWTKLSSGFLDKVEVATTDLDQELQRTELLELPGDEFLAQLAAESPPSEDPARLHLIRGRDRLMREITDAPEAAIVELEQAAIAAPRDVTTLAALAEIYGLAGKYHSERADQAVVLLSRADALGLNVPAVLRARTVIAMGAGSYENAKRVANDCIDMDPDNLHCKYYKGIAMVALEQWAAAEEILTEVHRAAPHVPRFRLALCGAAVESGSYHKAGEMVEDFIAEYPHVAEGWALSARLSWLTAQYDEALDSASKAIRIDPSDLSSRVLVTELLLAKGQAAKAEATLQPLLDDPGIRKHKLGGHIYLIASYIQTDQGKLESAMAYAETAQELQPHWGPPAFAKGTVLALSGDLLEAERTFKNANTESLRPVEAGHFWVRLGHIYREQRRDKAAMTAYERAIEEYPHSEEARLGMVEVYLRLGNLSKALDMLRTIGKTDFEQDDTHPPNSLLPLPKTDVRPLAAAFREAISNDIRHGKAMQEVEGILAYHAGEYQLGELALRQALRDDDTNDIARAYLARIKMQQGEYAEAEGILQRLLATPGNEGIYSAMLGVARARTGRGAGGVAELERISKLVSDVPAAHRYYAEALFLAGEPTKAMEAARNAYRLDDLDHYARRLVSTQGVGER